MNCKCISRLSFDKHIWSKNENIFLIYNCAQINLKFILEKQKQIVNLDIIAENENTVKKVFLTVLQYLFIALGSVPDFEYFKINDKDDLYPAYYECAKKYQDKDSTLFDINSNTLNAEILTRVDTLSKDFPILNTLISLNSKNYEYINEEHRITLLIHCMEGFHRITTGENYKFIKDKNGKTKKVKITLKDRLDEILKDIYDYNDNFEAGIDKFYGGRDSQLFANIRNKYSHFINQDIKSFVNDDYIFAFFILRYSLRLSIAKFLGVQIDMRYVKEYLFILHDWVNDTKGIDELPKSIPYNFRRLNNLR